MSKKLKIFWILFSAFLIGTGILYFFNDWNWQQALAAPDSVTFNYTGAQQTWVVPAGITSIQVDAKGGEGGDGGVRWPPPEGEGGDGARVQATLSVTPGETLYIYVGGSGSITNGGWNGGGDGGTHGPSDGYDAGGGGGASDIRQGGSALDDRVIVAGGGGGGGGMGWANSVHGGVGGSGGENGADGGSGINSSGDPCATGGGGGTQSSGGAYPGCGSAASGGTDGGYGYGGHGCSGDLFLGGGGAGGGSGYYGGGGGGYSGWCGGAGGGGGSSYSSGTGTTYASGYQSGNGQIIIIYTPLTAAPTVVTNSATNVQQTQATLNGNLTDMGGESSCDVWFEWGTLSGSYSDSTTPVAKTSIGNFNETISGLTSETTYYFRAVAQNSEGTSYGSELSFFTPAVPISEYDVWGWAWSENIGWVSFNCLDGGQNQENICGDANYGVKIDKVSETIGELNGYAWSEHIGWIDFASAGPYPDSPNYSAQVDLDTGYVSGWAKAIVNGTGWDGWLRLRDTTYGTWIDTEPDPSEFMNWAWSDLNIGWLSFNCRNQDVCGTSGYKVMTSLDFEPEIPVPNVYDPDDVFDDLCAQSRIPTLSWDTDASTPYDYEIQIDNDPGFLSPEVTDQVLATNNTFWLPTCSYCCNTSPYNNISWGNQTYNWRIRARNVGGEWSDWAGDSFTTKAHCYPYPDFLCNGMSCSIANLNEDDPVTLTDDSSYYNGRDHCVWALPVGATVISGNINWDCEIDVQFTTGESQPVTLTVFDTAGYNCPETKNIDVSVSLTLPKWKEIKP